MSVTVTCECGHVTELADLEQPGDAASVATPVCPACGRALAMPAPAGKRMFQQLWHSHVSDDSPATVSVAPTTKESAPARRSLWDVMRSAGDTNHGELESPTDDHRQVDTSADTSSVEAHKPKGLWSLMHVAAPATQTSTEETGIESREVVSKEIAVSESKSATSVASAESAAPAKPELSPEEKYAQAASLASMTHVSSTWQPEPEPEPFDEDEREWSRRAVTALFLAVLTVMVAGLSYRQEWWWRGPALMTGLVAVVLGFTASSDVRRSRGRLKGRWAARAGVLIGACGMFLAPMLFARLGEQMRESTRRDEIDGRLRRIGQALDQFQAQHGHYPEAAVKGRDAHGDNVPMHGWMTPLLPALGHDAIYRRIDLQQPYDAPANVAAMQQPIPEFTLPRRKPARSPRGLALTYFSGVGGQDVREPTGLVHLGLFSDGGPVRREQFTDGLSQTLIVGEIRDAPPPWGEPGNVRSLGEGLNRQFRGFGNANGTGATFLHADGSVKFYSNKTDRRVLQRLETRDGAEPE